MELEALARLITSGSGGLDRLLYFAPAGPDQAGWPQVVYPSNVSEQTLIYNISDNHDFYEVRSGQSITWIAPPNLSCPL